LAVDKVISVIIRHTLWPISPVRVHDTFGYCRWNRYNGYQW